MKNLLIGLAIGTALGALGLTLWSRTAAPATTAQMAGAVDGVEVRCPAEQLAHNRELVRAFFAPDRSPLDAYNMMTPGYVQHNEGVRRFGEINGLADREAFKAIDELLTQRAQRPELLAEAGRPRNEMAFSIIATCDHVIAMHRIYLPDPQEIGAFYTAYDFELWRIEQGKFAEHWDSQKIPTPLPDFVRVPMPLAGADAP